MDLLFPYAHLNLSGEAISEYPLEEDLLGGFVVFRRAVRCASHARSGQPNA